MIIIAFRFRKHLWLSHERQEIHDEMNNLEEIQVINNVCYQCSGVALFVIVASIYMLKAFLNSSMHKD
jgi:hypothetical protein